MQYYLYNNCYITVCLGLKHRHKQELQQKKPFIGYTERNLTGGKNSVLLKTQQSKASQGGGLHWRVTEDFTRPPKKCSNLLCRSHNNPTLVLGCSCLLFAYFSLFCPLGSGAAWFSTGDEAHLWLLGSQWSIRGTRLPALDCCVIYSFTLRFACVAWDFTDVNFCSWPQACQDVPWEEVWAQVWSVPPCSGTKVFGRLMHIAFSPPNRSVFCFPLFTPQ